MPAPSGGAVAAAARASASPRSQHRSLLFSSIVPHTELYFTPTKLVQRRRQTSAIRSSSCIPSSRKSSAGSAYAAGWRCHWARIDLSARNYSYLVDDSQLEPAAAPHVQPLTASGAARTSSSTCRWRRRWRCTTSTLMRSCRAAVWQAAVCDALQVCAQLGPLRANRAVVA